MHAEIYKMTTYGPNWLPEYERFYDDYSSKEQLIFAYQQVNCKIDKHQQWQMKTAIKTNKIAI